MAKLKRTRHGAIITQTLKATKDYVDEEKFKENVDLPFQLQSKLTEQLELVQSSLRWRNTIFVEWEVWEQEDGMPS